MTRSAASGVRASVAEDLLLAQRFFAARKSVVVMLGVKQLSTRMRIPRQRSSTVGEERLRRRSDAAPFGKLA
jgi:hypothetical protein